MNDIVSIREMASASAGRRGAAEATGVSDEAGDGFFGGKK
jgi:hypothetical protein